MYNPAQARPTLLRYTPTTRGHTFAYNGEVRSREDHDYISSTPLLSVMISTEFVSSPQPLIVQRLSGTIDQTEVEQGINAAWHLIDQILAQHPAFDLLLDLREVHFADLHAHKAWRLGFLAHPTLMQHTGRAAIISSDTPAFRAEQQLLGTATCRFFLDGAAALAWLATAIEAMRWDYGLCP
jgi:hypothetical protein